MNGQYHQTLLVAVITMQVVKVRFEDHAHAHAHAHAHVHAHTHITHIRFIKKKAGIDTYNPSIMALLDAAVAVDIDSPGTHSFTQASCASYTTS